MRKRVRTQVRDQFCEVKFYHANCIPRGTVFPVITIAQLIKRDTIHTRKFSEENRKMAAYFRGKCTHPVPAVRKTHACIFRILTRPDRVYRLGSRVGYLKFCACIKKVVKIFGRNLIRAIITRV